LDGVDVFVVKVIVAELPHPEAGKAKVKDLDNQGCLEVEPLEEVSDGNGHGLSHQVF
jgi:hypothetical protein